MNTFAVHTRAFKNDTLSYHSIVDSQEEGYLLIGELVCDKGFWGAYMANQDGNIIASNDEKGFSTLGDYKSHCEEN